MDESNICVHCGAPFDDGLIFCRKCGAALRSSTSLIQARTDDVKTKKVSHITRIVVTIVRGVAAIAGVVAIFCSFATWTQVLMLMGSVVVLLICHFVLAQLDDNYLAEHMKDGYWPSKPMTWSPLPPHDADEQRKGE